MNFKTHNLTKILYITSLAFATNACVPALVLGGTGVVGYTAAQERSVGAAIDDAAIETEINAEFLAYPEKDLFLNIDVDSVEGKVLLIGSVPSRQARLDAYKIAWRVKGVKEVINEIKLDKDSEYSVSRLASDSWISTQIQSKLLFAKDVSSINYSIETIDGSVYLMGVARNREELEEVARIASTVSGVKRVVSHVRIKGFEEADKLKISNKPVSNPIIEDYNDSDILNSPIVSDSAYDAPKYSPPAEVEEIEGLDRP